MVERLDVVADIECSGAEPLHNKELWRYSTGNTPVYQKDWGYLCNPHTLKPTLRA